MSKQCPNCKGYNTELSVMGSAEYAIKGLAKAAVIAGGFVGGGLLCGPYGAMTGGKEAKRITSNWTEGVNLYYCNTCGKEFE